MGWRDGRRSSCCLMVQCLIGVPLGYFAVSFGNSATEVTLRKACFSLITWWCIWNSAERDGTVTLLIGNAASDWASSLLDLHPSIPPFVWDIQLSTGPWEAYKFCGNGVCVLLPNKSQQYYKNSYILGQHFIFILSFDRPIGHSCQLKHIFLLWPHFEPIHVCIGSKWGHTMHTMYSFAQYVPSGSDTLL